MFVYREAYYQRPGGTPRRRTRPNTWQWQEEMDQIRHVAEVIIGKQRHGPIGNVKLSFNDDTVRFGNLAREGRYDPH